MTRPPWRPQDIPDAILGRDTRSGLPPASGLPGVGYEVESDTYVDDAFVVFWYTDRGVVAVVWPMKFGPRKDN